MNFLMCLFMLFGLDHGLYVSVTEVKYNENETWEISCRIFDTDLEDAIRNQSGKSVSLRTDEEVKNSEALIARYINEKVHFMAKDGKQLAMNWVKGSSENDTVWAYFTIEYQEFTTVENTLLIELFNDQENVVSIELDGKKQYLRFNSGVKRLSFKD